MQGELGARAEQAPGWSAAGGATARCARSLCAMSCGCAWNQPGLDQPLLVEKCLAPAGHGHAFEQASLGERVLGDEALGFGPLVGVDDQKAAVAARAVVVDERACREQLVLVLGQVLQVSRAGGCAQLGTAGTVLRLDRVGHRESS